MSFFRSLTAKGLDYEYTEARQTWRENGFTMVGPMECRLQVNMGTLVVFDLKYPAGFPIERVIDALLFGTDELLPKDRTRNNFPECFGMIFGEGGPGLGPGWR